MNTPKKARDRQARIRDMLQKKDVIGIQEFCERLDVSIATIRNDLTFLEKNGYLKRVIGGAVSTEGTPRNTIYSSRINLYREEKQRIAHCVVDQYIKPGMTVILDAGTTCFCIAEYLLEKDIPCQVITNAFNVVSCLSRSTAVEVFSAGGKLDKEHNAYFDSIALASLKGIKADIYFLSPNGIDGRGQITGSSEQENCVKKYFSQSAGKIIAVADSSKFNKVAAYFIIELSEVDHVITDYRLDDDTARVYEGRLKIERV